MAKVKYNTRRQFLKAIPAFAVVGATTPALAATETPVMRAYRDWLAFRDRLNSETDGMSDDEFSDLCSERLAMERAMFDLPSASLHDAALKLLAFTDNGNDFQDDCRDTGARLVREIEAFAA